MLENIRENSQGMIAKIVLGFIVLTFAIAGIGNYTNSVDTSVAVVNGEKISQQAFQKAYQLQRSRMEQQFGEMFQSLAANPSYMANLRNNVLEDLIVERLLDQQAETLAIKVSDERIKEVIRNEPAFQVDGVFDNNTYLARINQAGYAQAINYRNELRRQIPRTILTQGVAVSDFALPYQAKIIEQLNQQKRDLRFATIAVEQFKAQVEVSDEEIANHYQANLASFQKPEKVKLNYLVLDVADIAKTINTSEADALAYYEANKAKYTQQAKRRVSHILIATADGAKAKAEEVLAKAQAGEDFVKLAKTYSADTFSAENGGDLDWLEAGVMVQAFEDAAMQLNAVGQLSPVVETDFGFHVIKLTDYKAEAVSAFADVKDEVIASINKDAAQAKFFELQEELKRVSFEFPDSLLDSAEVIKGEVKTSDWLARGGNPAPFNNPKVIEAMFSSSVLNENLNSEVIEVSDNQAVVVHLNEYQAAEAKSLAEVSEQIKQTLLAQKASVKATEESEVLLSQLLAGEDITAKLAALNASFVEKADIARNDTSIDASIVRKAFGLAHPEEGKVSAATVALNNGDNVLVVVQAVKTPNVEITPQLTNQVSQQLMQEAYLAYVAKLTADADISRRSLAAETPAF